MDTKRWPNVWARVAIVANPNDDKSLKEDINNVAVKIKTFCSKLIRIQQHRLCSLSMLGDDIDNFIVRRHTKESRRFSSVGRSNQDHAPCTKQSTDSQKVTLNSEKESTPLMILDETSLLLDLKVTAMLALVLASDLNSPNAWCTSQDIDEVGCFVSAAKLAGNKSGWWGIPEWACTLVDCSLAQGRAIADEIVQYLGKRGTSVEVCCYAEDDELRSVEGSDEFRLARYQKYGESVSDVIAELEAFGGQEGLAFDGRTSDQQLLESETSACRDIESSSVKLANDKSKTREEELRCDHPSLGPIQAERIYDKVPLATCESVSCRIEVGGEGLSPLSHLGVQNESHIVSPTQVGDISPSDDMNSGETARLVVSTCADAIELFSDDNQHLQSKKDDTACLYSNVGLVDTVSSRTPEYDSTGLDVTMLSQLPPSMRAEVRLAVAVQSCKKRSETKKLGPLRHWLSTLPPEASCAKSKSESQRRKRAISSSQSQTSKRRSIVSFFGKDQSK